MAAPEGNTNAARGTKAKHALEVALNLHSQGLNADSVVEGNGMKSLVMLWLKQLEKSIEVGDNGSANMIVDRLDGKAVTAVEADVDMGLTVEVVQFAGTDSE